MKLAISSPSRSGYSETFVRMQMKKLPCALGIFGRPVAEETVPGGAITPQRSVRGILELAFHCGLKGGRWEGPQGCELLRRLRGHRISVLLANYGPGGVAMLPICRKAGIPLVVHFHGYDAHSFEIVSKYRSGYRALGQEAAAVIVVSNVMSEALASSGIPRSKIRLARYGVSQSEFTCRKTVPANPLFVGVGRFVDKKAPHLSVLAFKRVREQMPNARLLMIGDGPLLDATRNLAFALGLADGVTFPGALPPEQVSCAMRSATAFVQHSLVPAVGVSAGDREGTPVALLEAMMSALPVVSTRHAGIAEVVAEGRTGFLVDERDVQSMGEAMLKLAVLPELNRAMGEAARQAAIEHHTESRYVGLLLEILMSVNRSSGKRRTG